jgi:hypothetical protein
LLQAKTPIWANWDIKRDYKKKLINHIGKGSEEKDYE